MKRWLVALAALQKRHPTLAKVLGAVSIGVEVGAATYNWVIR